MVARRRRSLAAARRAAGYTQEGLAEALHVDRSTVQRWESGEHVPWPYLWPKLASVLTVSKERLQVLFAEDHPARLRQQLPPATPSKNREPRVSPWGLTVRLSRGGDGNIGISEMTPTRISMHAELLAQYESLTDNYRHIDYQAGSRAAYGDAVAHLNRLLAAVDQVPSELYGRYIALLGDTAQLAAWLAIDGQDYPTARHFCSIALSSAEEGQDPTLHAYVLGVMSYIHLHAQRGNEAVRLLDGALRLADTPRFGVNPAVRSWLYEALGEAHAFAGDRHAGAAALARAEQLFDCVQPATVPRWLGFFNGQEHAARLKGRCLMRLGDGRVAIATLRTACELLPEQYVRERSGTLIDLATAQLVDATQTTNSAEPEAAADTAQEAWRLALLTDSGRNQRRVKELLPSFRPYAHLECVQALAHAVR
jgi:transcriptional regulator with XRE-family HTH domain